MLEKSDKTDPNGVAPQKTNTSYTFGLDIGIASVRWAVLGDSRITDLGVRLACPP